MEEVEHRTVMSRKPNAPVDDFVAAQIGTFGEAPESALGTGDRIISFNSLQIDHLSKQQVVGS
jgi:hypothetical protein